MLSTGKSKMRSPLWSASVENHVGECAFASARRIVVFIFFDVVEEGGDLRVHALCYDVDVFGWNVGVCEGDFDLVGQVYDEDLMFDV